MTFGYDAAIFTKPFSKKSAGRIFTFAETLLSDLSDHRDDNVSHMQCTH
jgi:hypothetical protein